MAGRPNPLPVVLALAAAGKGEYKGISPIYSPLEGILPLNSPLEGGKGGVKIADFIQIYDELNEFVNF